MNASVLRMSLISLGTFIAGAGNDAAHNSATGAVLFCVGILGSLIASIFWKERP